MNKIQLAIVEDNEMFRNTLIKTIKMESDFEIALVAEDGLQLLESLKKITPDIILMDICMPKMNGLVASTKVMELYPCIKIIAYSQFDNEANIIEMYIRGVTSFIGKDTQIDDLFRAIRTVNSGAVYATVLASEIIQRNLSLLHPKTDFINKLTDFELMLLRSICNGGSSVQLGESLNRSPRTIEEHREKLYKKIGVKTKDELFKKVYAQNLPQNLK